MVMVVCQLVHVCVGGGGGGEIVLSLLISCYGLHTHMQK